MNRYVLFALMFLTLSVSLVAVQPSNARTADFWIAKASMPTDISPAGAAAVNGTIYVFEWSSFQSITYAYNINTDSWAIKAAMPTPRWGFATVAYQNKIYCIGGFLSNSTVTGVNEIYDPSTNTWETKASMSTPRCSLSANVVDGKIYLIGGDAQGSSTTTTVNINEVYDPSTDSWTSASAIPSAVDNYASAVAYDRIYVIGGSYGNEVSGENLNQIYDPETNTWSQRCSIPAATWDAAAGATTGAHAPIRIYVVGGNPTENPNSNYAYDPETNTWTNATSMPNGCYWPALAVVNDQLYVIGGAQNHVTYYAGLTTNEQYTPIGYNASTSTIPEIPIWMPLSSFMIVAAFFVAALKLMKLRKQRKRFFPETCFL